MTPRGVVFALIAIVCALVLLLDLAGAPPTVLFVLSGVAISGLAWLVGVATEQLGSSTGSKISGLLNIAFGNAAELVITILALRAGLLTLVRASITGSILGNLLLVLGFSILVGGLKNGQQRFSRLAATTSASALMIAVIGLIVPAVFAQAQLYANQATIVNLSTGIAIVLIVTYALSLVFFFETPGAGGSEAELAKHTAWWSVTRSVAVLAGATIVLAVLSEVLVSAVEPALKSWGLSEAFTGLIIIPIIGNAAEHVVSVQFAYRNDMEFAMVVSLGSSLQVALLVAPLLVLLSHLAVAPLTLVFSPLEIVTVALSVVVVTVIASDGRSHWFEGAQLLAVYGIVGLTFWFFR